MPESLDALLGRYSVGPKHLVEPGPSDEQLALMTRAALRAPDHAELVPYRFKLVRGAAKEGMAALFADAARAAGKGGEGAALDVERALKPPVTVAVVARIDLGHPLVPAHEQWAAVGGAVSNFLTAAHLLGFGGKMLSGAKVRDPAIAAAFCDPGETLVGWIALGTPARKPSGPARKPASTEVMQDWHPPCKP
ncbi:MULTISPECIES: nitroreductase family protein [unclassified Roseateles]|uniref:nitroreductase family protein n=1 Tax=unclassified Roseateles TaxID=2626991 RepID=UPI0006FCEC34|nr:MULTISPECIES: nitroreductase family protein [unclassified Roseateles]KQW52288.1 nitroreductase [Pelomonas sp. Root405]KRA78522.1 nitroreductase [Pelomonas sp. Root662]